MLIGCGFKTAKGVAKPTAPGLGIREKRNFTQKKGK